MFQLLSRDGRRPTSRLHQGIAAVVFLFVTVWFIRSWSIEYTPEIHPPPDSEIIKIEEARPSTGNFLGHVLEGDIKEKIQASRIYIHVNESGDVGSIPLLHKLDIDIPGSSEIQVDNASSDPLSLSHSSTVAFIEVPHIEDQPDASEFLFGVATTYARLEIALDTMSHWLSSPNAALIGVMEPTADAELRDRVSKKAEQLNVSLKTIDSDETFLDRYFWLVRHLHDNRTPSTKWCVLVDDDTFFPDMRNLISTFKRRYDPSEPYYIGSLSEDYTQMGNWGYMAYGGGGIFLSTPLIDELQPVWAECYKSRNTGDRMLAACIYKHTTTKFTWEHGLHQVDLHGDHAGFYEALRKQPLSTHHWRGEGFGFKANFQGMSLVSSICGNTCLLQKFKIGHDWILTNGFSLVQFSKEELRHRDIDTDVSMERTWDFFYDTSTDAHFLYSLGPIRTVNGNGKIRFRMESAFRDTEGNVRQLYVKRRRREGRNDAFDGGEVEGAVEIIWSKS